MIMPEKPKKISKLANAIAEASLGIEVEKELDENFDDDTTAKVVEVDESEEGKNSGDDDDWKLDFERGTTATGISQRSALRTENAAELGTLGYDERYKGKKVTRKSADKSRLGEIASTIESLDEREHAAAELGHLLEGESEDEDSEGDENDSKTEDDEDDSIENDQNLDILGEENGQDYSTSGKQSKIDFSSFGGMSDEETTDDENGDTEKADEVGEESNDDNENGCNSVNVLGKKNSNEYLKGMAIKSQMAIWDRLLEFRIKIQKVLQCMNKFPQNDIWSAFVDEMNNGTANATNGKEKAQNANVKKCQSALVQCIDLLLDTRAKLLDSNPETKRALDDRVNANEEQPPKKKRKIKEYER